jgi:L-lysine 2,3-aminomutase
MKDKLRTLIIKLEQENERIVEVLEDKMCTKESYAVLTHKYNNTLSILKQLKEILLTN